MKTSIFKNFKESIGINYFKFSGNMNRYDYWRFVGLCIIIKIILNLFAFSFDIMNMNIMANILYFIKSIFIIFIIIPILAGTTRRLHDVGKPTWLIIFLVAPIITGIIGMYLAFFTINGASNFLIIVGIILLIITFLMPLYILYLTLLRTKE